MNDRLSQRAELLHRSRHQPELQALLLEQCRRDILFWFERFCWTFDPRIPRPHQPFELYPYQRELVKSFCRAIEQGEDLLVEKSRDMGVSWLILLVFQYYWLFAPGANFHLGSRKTEYVDRKGDISTLFEKLRYNLDWLPHWMRPAGFQANRHDNLLRLVNPDNGNVMTGESSNENFARGGRYKAVLFDEFPFWPVADAAYASAGQSTPCRFVVGTPYGKSNRFADLRFEGKTRIETVHWSRHPLKDEGWYQTQKQRMSVDEIARELDINYHLSQKDRVFHNFSEMHKADLKGGGPLPARIVRSWDFGYHCPACLFIALDGDDRVLVLHEEVGNRDLLVDFARRVLETSRALFPEAVFEDVCDPAGAQKSDKSVHTSIEILNSLGVYPFYDRSRILDGLELIRMKLAERIQGLPGFRVDKSCKHLIEAFEGGYRYPPSGQETPLQEHPFEDVVDCLRYAVIYKCSLLSRNPKKPRHYRPQNRYTGY